MMLAAVVDAGCWLLIDACRWWLVMVHGAVSDGQWTSDASQFIGEADLR